MMKKSIISFLVLGIMGFCGWMLLIRNQQLVHKNGIRLYNPATDKQAIYKIFKDEWYWLMDGDSPYSQNYVDCMLANRQSFECSKHDNLIIKVLEDHGRVAGFSAIYKKSINVGHILFIAVDRDFRRKGYAKELVVQALEDLFAQGYVKVSLDTRVGNTRARSLYSSLGFRLLETDEEMVHYVFYKNQQIPKIFVGV